MVRHHLVMDCSGHEGYQIVVVSTVPCTLLYKFSVDSVDIDALLVPGI